MANSAGEAIAQAARLPEIGFAEFTSKLVTDVFAALIDANIKQTQAYMDLVQTMATSLKDFINNTKDDITPQEISQFLNALGGLPALTAGQSLTSDQANNLNSSTNLPTEAGAPNNNQVAAAGALDDSKVKTIQEAVARRLAANKYNLLREMVKQGVLRLVVDNGIIETRLTFNTYGYKSWQKNTFDQSKSGGGMVGGAAAGYGGFGAYLPIFGGAGAGGLAGVGGLGGISVSTTSESQRDVNGSSVQIFGRVEIRFKTDYVPLNP